MRVETQERLWQGWPGAGGCGYARPFGGRTEDLDIDFATARAELVSAVLAHCLRPCEGDWSADEVWSWTLAQRLQGLLAVAQASGVRSLALLQRCGSCAESLEVEIDLGRFEREETVTEFTWSPEPDHTWQVALPTGRDQQEWSRCNERRMPAMAGALVRAIDGATPASEWEISHDRIEGLAQALERHDPLTALELETACPACRAATHIEVDLEAELLVRLHALQRQTLDDVHRLACAYHWSEACILQLPAWRRRYYLAQLGAVGDA